MRIIPMPLDWLGGLIASLNDPSRVPTEWFFSYSFNVKSLLAVILVSLICGSVGSLVVGNRMSFFSDALAHVAFAGAALGWLLMFAAGWPLSGPEFDQWLLV